jgi:Ran GTPase-activating protein (RanGAP) involved in mRNA processing and transport
MQSNLKLREEQFHKELQRSFMEIMETFAFKKEIKLSQAWTGTAAHSSLSEVMKLDGDHVILDYVTTFEGADLQDISRSMRRMKGEFSTE